MKRTIILSIILLIFSVLQLPAQTKILGDWETTLVAGQQKLKLIIHVSEDSSGYKGTLDSPDQGAFGIPFTSTEIKRDSLKVENSNLKLTVKAAYKPLSDSLYSDFNQGGAQFKLNWGRSTSVYKFNRPQTPKPPFPYKTEEVTFINKKANSIKFAGTLTLPNDVKNPPAAILISGSGPQDRDEKIMEHQPFFVLADYLTRNGIAVLRYDDRGTAKSEGDFGSATSTDFSYDAEAALEYLKTRNDIDVNKIGFIGHSEGGMIAPMIAARNKSTAFIVLLAGPGVTIDKLMLKQISDYMKAAGAPDTIIEKQNELNRKIFEVIRETENDSLAELRVMKILKETNFADGNEEQQRQYAQSKLSPWFAYFLRFTPSQYLEKVKCPVLAVNGELDKQVDAKMNLEAIREALKKANNKDYEIVSLPGLNHLLQEAATGNESEYIQIEQTISPQVMKLVSDWINKRFR